MIEFQAVLKGVKTERPVQSISYSLDGISAWIEKTLEKYPAGSIELFQFERKLLGKSYGKNHNSTCICGHTQPCHTKTTSTNRLDSVGACCRLDCSCKCFEESK